MGRKVEPQIKVVYNNARDILNPKSLAQLTKNSVMKVKKKGRTLNKLKVVTKTSLTKRKMLRKKSLKNGYFNLQGFAHYYQDLIKISYVTLYRRIHSNRDVLNTLIQRKIIEVYYVDIKDERTRKIKVKVFRSKRKEFIEFIIDNFLTDYQKGIE